MGRKELLQLFANPNHGVAFVLFVNEPKFSQSPLLLSQLIFMTGHSFHNQVVESGLALQNFFKALGTNSKDGVVSSTALTVTVRGTPA